MSYNKYFFIGVGGIGMSSIANYLIDTKNIVFGYDRSSNKLVDKLIDNGLKFTDKLDIGLVPQEFLDDNVIVVYTPAIKNDNVFLDFFSNKKRNKIFKRSEILGQISANSKCIAVAGTHGKTSTTAILSHLLYSNQVKFRSFVGGIMKGFDSNYISTGDEYVIIEADEYDRSFLALDPDYSLITSIEKDHLDVYDDLESILSSFGIFCDKTKKSVIAEKDINIKKDFSFSIDEDADYSADIIKNDLNGIHFDLKTPNNLISNIHARVIGKHNLKNVVSALSLIDQIEAFNLEEFIPYLSDFKGIERRMDIYKYEDKVIVDDYAHHPTEIKSIFDTIDSIYQDKPKAVIFQPHLYTRTRDLMDDFAKVLSYFQEVYLLDIYPAREKPINGITSEVLLNKIDASKKEIVKKGEINDIINKTNCKTIAILGAGDITVNLNKKIFSNE
jgi:UDP-N-acetylmuramate--alanine ligase